MNKQEFLAQLRAGLAGLPQEDLDERLSFYSEMLDDQMEEGLSEEEAVAAVGPVEEIVRQIIADTPLAKLAKERIRPRRRLKAWEIVLLVLGSPVWLTLGLAAVIVIFALYVVLWSVSVSLWAVFAALSAGSIGGVLACVGSVTGRVGGSGLAILAAGMVCAGLAIFLFFGCRAATKGILALTKNIAAWTKRCFLRKEDKQ